MTMMNQDKPSIDDVVEHSGVKGMKWGVRNAVSGTASSLSTHKEAFKDVKAVRKATPKYSNPRSKAYKVAKANVDEKSSNPKYAKAVQRIQKTHNINNHPAVRILKAYGKYKLVMFALTRGSASSRNPSYSTHRQRSQRGSDYLRTKPPMMNAKLNNGAYNITNL